MTMIKRPAAQAVAPRFFDSFLLKDFLLHDAHVKNGDAKVSQNAPAVNISVNEDAYFVELMAPGLNKDLINIALEKDELTISYKEEQKAEEGVQKNYLLKEFSPRSFSRSFTFPKNSLDEDKIVASYADGILRMELPKREESKPKPARQISIS